MAPQRPQAKERTTRAEELQALLKKADRHVLNGELESALTLTQNVEKRARALEDFSWIAKASFITGRILTMKGMFKEAIEASQTAYENASKSQLKELEINSLSNLGFSHLHLGNVEEALGIHRQCLQMRTDLNDIPGICTSLMNIGFVYGDQSDYASALESFTQVLHLARSHDLRRIERGRP